MVTDRRRKFQIKGGGGRGFRATIKGYPAIRVPFNPTTLLNKILA
jgi:hypothetical protein